MQIKFYFLIDFVAVLLTGFLVCDYRLIITVAVGAGMPKVCHFPNSVSAWSIYRHCNGVWRDIPAKDYLSQKKAWPYLPSTNTKEWFPNDWLGGSALHLCLSHPRPSACQKSAGRHIIRGRPQCEATQGWTACGRACLAGLRRFWSCRIRSLRHAKCQRDAAASAAGRSARRRRDGRLAEERAWRVCAA